MDIKRKNKLGKMYIQNIANKFTKEWLDTKWP